MPFLPPNQQRQSTEDKILTTLDADAASVGLRATGTAISAVQKA